MNDSLGTIGLYLELFRAFSRKNWGTSRALIIEFKDNIFSSHPLPSSLSLLARQTAPPTLVAQGLILQGAECLQPPWKPMGVEGAWYLREWKMLSTR